MQEHLIPSRRPAAEITDAHRDVAAALQECLDETLLHLCDHAGRATGLRRLALAGGVALNCTANGRLLRSGHFDEVYAQPAAGDDGSALGAALWRASRKGSVRNVRMPVPFLGPAATATDIDQALEEFQDRVQTVRFSDLRATCAEAAKLIRDGRVIAWYRGRMEFGPRALGHRSILADPANPGMRDRINAMVKMREAFRPFAPAVSLEQAPDWFEIAPGIELPYMIMTVDVRNQYRQLLPAITHVNGSARVQTVSKEDNGDFHALLKEVGKLTGREMVLNTSFNVKGQPIVNTPSEAIETFLGTGIEFLFLENIMVRRSEAADTLNANTLNLLFAIAMADCSLTTTPWPPLHKGESASFLANSFELAYSARFALLSDSLEKSSLKECRTISLLLDEQMARSPEATALVFSDVELTYRELEERVDELARHLHKIGVEPESLVGVFMNRSVAMVVAVLAILKAGGAYVPLDPANPRERIAHYIDDCRAHAILTTLPMHAPPTSRRRPNRRP